MMPLASSNVQNNLDRINQDPVNPELLKKWRTMSLPERIKFRDSHGTSGNSGKTWKQLADELDNALSKETDDQFLNAKLTDQQPDPFLTSNLVAPEDKTTTADKLRSPDALAAIK